MQKIANTLTGRTVLPVIGSLLTFADTSQTVFANNTVALTVSDYATWQIANPNIRVISAAQVIGNDAVPKLLVQHTALSVAEPENSVISQRIETGADAATLIANFQTWKTANPFQKIVRTTQMTGLDGGLGLLIEYGLSSTIPNISNSSMFQTFFPDAGGVNTSYSQYSAWKSTAANASLKPYRLTNVIGLDGTTGLLVEYTTIGTSPSVSQLQLSYIDNVFVVDVTFPVNIQTIKTNAPGSQIYRITPVFQGFIVESTLNGTTPVNSSVLQSSYNANPGASDAATAYQVFKTANPTLKPIRTTPITWGDGSNLILAEYIN